jgi:hypothetical protein
MVFIFWYIKALLLSLLKQKSPVKDWAKNKWRNIKEKNSKIKA